jgi:ATP-dependent DNA helicase RecG
MNEQELLDLLSQHEWKDVEFKEARRAVSKSVYETVSAFANTEGGHLVFGIKEGDDGVEVVGVIDVDKVQNDFITTVRQKSKINQIIDIKEDLHKINDKDVLVFYVPEISREYKPVYLNENISKSYVRKGACDVKCSQDEINRMLRDASVTRYDSEVLTKIPTDIFFDESSVRWYRRILDQNQPGRHQTLSDKEFLLEWGFLMENSEGIYPTRGAILLFGKGRYIRQILPRPIVDYQRINQKFEIWDSEKRWDDREVFEENIIQTWLGLLEKYSGLSEIPFSIDPKTMRRHDNPPDYITFREAVINLLIHQDYGDHLRLPEIHFYQDRTIFKNPGDAYGTTEELLEPGAKEVRNPSIVSAFRRIGLSDQAGSGIRSIFQNWGDLGNTPPLLNNNKSGKYFELILLKEKLLSKEQVLFQESIGVHLTDLQAKVFAYACKNGKMLIIDIKAITNKSKSECKKIADQLVTQVLLKWTNQTTLEVERHLFDKFVSLKININNENDQKEQENNNDPMLAIQFSDKQVKIIDFCRNARSMTEIQKYFEFSNRTYFKRTAIDPLIDARLLQMTNPEKPKSKNQKYVSTELGMKTLGISQIKNE